MTTDRIPASATIAHARQRLTQDFGRLLYTAIRKSGRRLRALGQRIALSRHHRRDIEMLLHANDRMLADIGLTRVDVIAAAQEDRRWFGRRRSIEAAAARRDDAMQVAARRHSRLPKEDAPSLVPLTPCVLETSNFR